MSKTEHIPNKLNWIKNIFIVLIFIVLDSFFLIYSYNTEVSKSKKNVLNELNAIARSATLLIDGDAHEKIEKMYLNKDDIKQNDDDSTYLKLHNTLAKIKETHLLTSSVYTMMLERSLINKKEETKFVFGVSSEQPFFRHPYIKVPKELIENFAIGGVIEPYKTENGIWLSAYQPIHNSNNKLVGVVQFDKEFKGFVIEAFQGIISSIFFSLVLLILIIIVLFKVAQQELKLKEYILKQKNIYTNLSAYAKEIGNGNFEVELKEISNNDALGNALLQMSQKLKKNKENDLNQKWLIEAKNKLSTVISQNEALKSTTYKILETIITYLGAVQGCIFIAKDNQLDLISSYAYGKEKYTTATYQFGDGLIGEVALDQKTIHRTKLPENHLTISSGLIKDQKPKALLIVPLVNDNELQGVIEIAAFYPFSTLQIQLVEDLAEIAARAIYNIKVNEKTAALLNESQIMTAELKEQQLTLKKNAIEMQANQKEIEQTNSKLEHQIEEVNNAQTRLFTLLENASEIITIYDEKSIIKYESPSIKNILGYNPEDFLGKKMNPIFNEFFINLLKNPTQTKTIKLEHVKKDGTKIWLETIGRNFLHDAAINGIIFNSTDITERRNAEQEQLMRGKMQALSENSSDIIMRFDLEGNFQYVNPALEKYTYLDKKEVLGKALTNLSFDASIKTAWQNIISQVKRNKKLVEVEINFPTKDGLKIMEVNAIPEFDEQSNLETILLVSHDITNRKKQAFILEQTNKKIIDSINYAKRIQNAIIPNITHIKKELVNSFIFYKPKDVVSGDFPYYLKKGDFIYFAAVDCTGHGVPGAMMSLIGHLLLNDILNNPEILPAGEVLNLLHKGIVKTLKQDEGEGVKNADGMDIALCRINLMKKELQFAGAHRPLYMVRENELTEYKGDRYPIGGNLYNDKNNFTTHKVKIKKNDTIYFFTDGFPDQFGGPNNLKYGPKKIRQEVLDTSNLEATEIKTYFEDSFHRWMGDLKQIDDVLFIGIKF